MNPLQQFYNDEFMREAVKSYLITHLDRIALERVYENPEDVYGLGDARKTINKAFVELDEKYGKKVEKKIVNQSR